MNRARRTVVVNKKPPPKVVDDDEDDFESVSASSDSGEDFSASEEEWVPGKTNKSGRESASDDQGSDGSEVDEDDNEDPTAESGSDESVVASNRGTGKKRTFNNAAKQQQPKKKRLSPGARNELYKRTKNHLLKATDPERPPLNSSVADILKLCQFQKKRDITQSGKVQKSAVPAAKKAKGKEDDSDSSGDDYLIDPKKLDLNSEFFDRVEVAKPGESAPPQFDCNAGMRLSDSSDGEEQGEDNVPASIPRLAANQLISKINESSSGFMNFNNLGEFTKKMEEAKELLKNYQAKEALKLSQESKGEDISNLLALGETEVGISSGPEIQASQQEEAVSEESDWEEVEEAKKSQATQKPREDYRITVEVETNRSKKKRWEEIEMELYIKRQINKVKRDNQLAFHKTSVLCAVAGGRKLNEIVNSDKIQATALSLMQSKQCLPKGKPDQKFVEQLIQWFKELFVLKGQQMLSPDTINVTFTLALELFTKNVACKRDYVLLCLAFLRAAGVPCRLVTSATVPPKRPAMKDLCPISERQLFEKFEKEFCKKGRSTEESSFDTSPEKTSDAVAEMKAEDLKSENKTSKKNSDTTPPYEIVDGSNGKSIVLNASVKIEPTCKSKSNDAKNVSDKKVQNTRAKRSTKDAKNPTEEKTSIKSAQESSVPKSAQESSGKNNTIETEHDSLNNNVATKDDNSEPVKTSTTRTTRASRLTLPKIQVETKGATTTRARSRSKSAQQSRDPTPEPSKKLRFSPVTDVCPEDVLPPSSSPSAKENAKTRRSILKRSSPRTALKSDKKNSPSRKALNTLNIPQLDGANDLVSTPRSARRTRRLRSRVKPNAQVLDTAAAVSGSPFAKRKTNTPLAKEQNISQPGKIMKRKLFQVNNPVEESIPSKSSKRKPAPTSKNKILSACSSSETEESSTEAAPNATQSSPAINKKARSKAGHKTKLSLPPDSDFDDSDFEPPEGKKAKKTAAATKVKSKYPAKKKVATSKKKKKVGKGDDIETSTSAASTAAGKMDVWIEFYSEKDKRWITLDIFTGKIDCVDYLARHATSPISYVFGFDNDNHIKDITPRYVQHWNTVSRKLRVESKWLDKALKPFLAEKTAREKLEDTDLNKIDIEKPLPTTIAECKNHPLYILKRHLLKHDALYPADVPSLGFVRGEAIYARECMYTLQSREKWYKQGRVVKAFETAYKVVKSWKYDKLKNEWLKNQPCDIFGIWQTEEYDPPTAENGMVPRNEYGNVELFTPKMLPKKTVHLKLPGLNKVCRRLGIDCAQALTGFEKARMRMIPVYDGFVVCEEFADQLVEEWFKEMEEEDRKEQEKLEKRVFGNWKRLIRGLLVRRRLQNKYNFDNV